METQLPLFAAMPSHIPVFPSTRYQGSKRQLCDWITYHVQPLNFETVLDVFGGTGAVSHRFKSLGKAVTYNDALRFNWIIGRALIENSAVQLTSDDLNIILSHNPDVHYPDFIAQTFAGIYFTDEENQWLDRVVYNIDHQLEHPLKQALARFALFQACIIKRPYNLFHRANLYMRQAEVKRTFGNKTTWDTPFEAHFRTFVEQANQAVFNNQQANHALNVDALATPIGADLVYIDPPYLNQKGVGVDYRDFYHFLEGLTFYDTWGEQIDWQSKHRRLLPVKSDWNRADRILPALAALLERHAQSILVLSYREDGIPTKAQLIDLLKKFKSQVQEAQQPKKYALSVTDSKEILLIAT